MKKTFNIQASLAAISAANPQISNDVLASLKKVLGSYNRAKIGLFEAVMDNYTLGDLVRDYDLNRFIEEREFNNLVSIWKRGSDLQAIVNASGQVYHFITSDKFILLGDTVGILSNSCREGAGENTGQPDRTIANISLFTGEYKKGLRRAGYRPLEYAKMPPQTKSNLSILIN